MRGDIRANLMDPARVIAGSTDLDGAMEALGFSSIDTNPSWSLLNELPTPALANALMNDFLNNVNKIDHSVPHKLIRDYYDAFWSSNFVKLSIEKVNIYSTMMLAFALSAKTIQGCPLFPQDDSKKTTLASRRFYCAGRKAILISTMLGKEDLLHCISLILATRFLYLDRRLAEARTCISEAVKTAYALQLHRNVRGEDGKDKILIWCTIYSLEKLLSLTIDGPSFITDRLCNTKPDENSFTSITIHRYKLARIFSKIVDLSQQILVHKIRIKDNFSIEEDILDFESKLPVQLQSNFNSTGQDIDPLLFMQNILLQRGINLGRIALHGKYFMRSSVKYHESQKKCIQAAERDICITKDSMKYWQKVYGARTNVPVLFRKFLGSSCWFNSIVIITLHHLSSSSEQNKDSDSYRRARFYLIDYLDTFDSRAQESESIRNCMRYREAHILRNFINLIDERAQGSNVNPLMHSKSKNFLSNVTDWEAQMNFQRWFQATALDRFIPSTSDQTNGVGINSIADETLNETFWDE
jgi:hypothetical protein